MKHRGMEGSEMNQIKIKNYTSTVQVHDTIVRIEARLAAAGANGITKLYNERREITALVFEIHLADRRFRIRVPANVDACFEAMWKEHCLHHRRARESTKDTIRDQAHRTAWKLVQDWVDVQISMIVMRQAEFLEVFLPYIWDGQQTFFTAMKGSGFKQLAEKNQ